MTNTSKDWGLLGNSSPTRRVTAKTYLANQVRLKFNISLVASLFSISVLNVKNLRTESEKFLGLRGKSVPPWRESMLRGT